MDTIYSTNILLAYGCDRKKRDFVPHSVTPPSSTDRKHKNFPHSMRWRAKYFQTASQVQLLRAALNILFRVSGNIPERPKFSLKFVFSGKIVTVLKQMNCGFWSFFLHSHARTFRITKTLPDSKAWLLPRFACLCNPPQERDNSARRIVICLIDQGKTTNKL